MRSDITYRLMAIAIGLVTVMAIGICGYHFLEGWSWFDSLYMTTISILTVGYGETHPLTAQGKAFTIFFLFIGIGMLTYALSTLTAFIVEGDLRDVLRRRRMEAKIAKLTGHYILCGAGRTGRTIIEELQKTKRHFVVIDRDAAAVAALVEQGVLALQGDATTDDAVLVQAGIDKAKGLFGALPDDPDNAFVALSAKGLNPKIRIIAKAQHGASAEKLRRSGADAVVSPEFIGGLRMASEMVRPAVVGFLDSMIRAGGQSFRIEEVAVPEDSPVKGIALGEIKGGQGECALILAVKHPQEKTYELNPPPTRTLSSGEILVAMGSVEHLQALEKRVGVVRG
ncbi:MAG: NAD-binding protein [Elusimicrobia bacterium]|nr:NAD-binding protein [Elusimicrobiota bacterium]